jgi:hypothetical protein
MATINLRFSPGCPLARMVVSDKCLACLAAFEPDLNLPVTRLQLSDRRHAGYFLVHKSITLTRRTLAKNVVFWDTKKYDGGRTKLL